MGCGPGTITNVGYYLTLQNKYHIYGIDFLKNNVVSAKMRFPKGTFSVGNAEKIPFKNNTFDFVLSRHVLEHVDNPEKMIKEIKRVIKKGGIIQIAVPHPSIEKRLIPIMPHYMEKGHHHQRVFDEKTIKKLLKDSKLKIISCQNKKWVVFCITYTVALMSRYFTFVTMEEQSGVFQIGKTKYLNNSIMQHTYFLLFKIFLQCDKLFPYLNKKIPFEIEVIAQKI